MLTKRDLFWSAAFAAVTSAVLNPTRLWTQGMRQSRFREYNDVIWWPTGAGWKNQSLDEQARVAFIDKIAAPVLNKMFECGLIP